MQFLKQILKFLVTGGLSACITLMMTNLCLFFGIGLFEASLFGYASGILNSFFLNQKWTFRHRGQRSKVLFIIFVCFNLFVMFLFGGLNLFFLNLIHHEFFAQIISLGCVTILNFFTYKYLIFRP